MDALLPSEIARLVLGYLQEQKCDEAAKLFMETSPLLHECRLVAQRSGRYPTRVGGLSLTDILHKYCAANAMIQEKLSKVGDLDQLKHCNDILEQLGYLLEGSRKRFVVNINYSSSQGSPAAQFGTPSSSGSGRKRHSSNENRSKRVARSLNTLLDKSSQNQVNRDCDIVEDATVDSLLNHKPVTDQVGIENKRFGNDQVPIVTDVNSIKESRISTSLNVNSDVNIEVSSSNNVHNNYKDQATETVQIGESDKNVNKYTAGTSTEELMDYCSTEVQTGFDCFDTESDTNLELRTEPIQNLSFITQEIMNRTEIQQRIAENINKANLTMEASMREDNANLNSTDMNKSKLSDFDDVIKSVVKATESDLEGILREIFEINELEPQTNDDQRQNYVPEAMDFDMGNSFNQDVHETVGQVDQEKLGGSEIPIKQRLRSSSKSYNADGEEKDALLEDQNAEAIMNIINVISSKRNSVSDSEQPIESNIETNEEAGKENAISVPDSSVKEVTTQSTTEKPTKTKKTRVKKQKQPVKKPIVRRGRDKKIVTDDDGIPMVVLCPEMTPSKSTFIPIAPKPGEPPPSPRPVTPPTLSYRVVNVPRQFVKPEQMEMTKLNTMVQKTLEEYQVKSSDDPDVVPIIATSNVPSQSTTSTATGESITLYGASESPGSTEVTTVVPIADMPIISIDNSTIAGTGLSPFFKDSIETEEVNVVVLTDTSVSEIASADSQVTITQNVSDKKTEEKKVNEKKAEEKKTEEEKKEVVEEKNMKKVEEKETEKKEQEEHKENVDDSKSAAPATVVEPAEFETTRALPKNDEIIVKRTPTTLLNSRKKHNNSRLSLSTPRRRNSHVRALDFDTPVKQVSIAKKGTQSCVKASVCRSSLFKSPTYEGSSDAASAVVQKTLTIVRKVRTLAPVNKHSTSSTSIQLPPIATRSPAPKLRGGWSKVAGIGSILVESSTGESSPEKSQDCPTPPVLSCSPSTKFAVDTKPVESNTLKKSWDSDLRKIVGNSADEEEDDKTKLKSKRKSEKKNSTVKGKTKGKLDDQSKKNDPEGDAKKIDDGTKKDQPKAEATKSCEEVNKKEDKRIEDTKKENKKMQKIKSTSSPKVGISPVAKKLQAPVQQTIIKIITPASVKKSEAKLIHEDSSTINKMHFAKNLSLESVNIASRLLDLETPRKIEMAICVPPTPQVFATPAHSLRKSDHRPKVDVTIKDIVETPEFPVTPRITYTPKIAEEDPDKRPSPYYEPEEIKIKEIVDTEKVKVQTTVASTVTVVKKNVELGEHKAVEITQSGVIEKSTLVQSEKKEEEQEVESNRSDSKDTSHDTSNDTSKNPSKESIDEENAEDANTSVNSYSNSDDDDDSHDSSSSSSSSSSNSSSSFSTSNSSPIKAIPDTRDVIKNVHNAAGTMVDSSLLMESFSEISQEEIRNLNAKVNNEGSPRKVYSAKKNNPPKEEPKETPAKDENAEVVIFETPSVSEAERVKRRDSITNLNSQISAAVATPSQTVSVSTAAIEQSTTSSNSNSTKAKPEVSTKPKVIKIEKIPLSDGMTLQVSQMLQSQIARGPVLAMERQPQEQTISDPKLSHALEEKRLRVMAKCKGVTYVKPVVPLKNLKVNEANKKGVVIVVNKKLDEEKVTSMIDNLKDRPPEQTTQTAVVEEKVVNMKEEKVTIKEEKSMVVTRSTRSQQKADEEEDLAENKRATTNRSSSRKKTEQNSDQSRKQSENKTVEANTKKADKEARADTELPAKMVAVTRMPVENSKGISKAKVDLVKRDLFSDDENGEQRTTRLQATRRSTTLLESQKSSSSSSIEGSASNDNSKLLECLQLIPTNKSDVEASKQDKVSASPNTSQRNHVDRTIVYDESVPIKKRRRNYSSSELQNEYIFQCYDDDDCVLQVTPLEEIFGMDPKSKSKKKVSCPKKSPTKTIKKSKSSSNSSSNSKKDTLVPPLAASSPLVTFTTRKVSDEERKKKPCKRKATDDIIKVDSKSKPKAQALLKKVKIDEFLKVVHVKGK